MTLKDLNIRHKIWQQSVYVGLFFFSDMNCYIFVITRERLFLKLDWTFCVVAYEGCHLPNGGR